MTSSRGGALRVAAGILCSRVAGFLRDRAVAYYFGVGPHADVFRTALRGPNILQNLLGEGTISASFIPIYSRLLAEHREEEAGRFAGAIFGLLLASAGALALAGVLLARPIVAVLAPGFLGDAASGGLDRYELAVTAVRIVFPMTGVLVLSAWALGVLNSHRRFFLAYVAPVLWNAAIIAGLVVGASVLAGAADLRSGLVVSACLGALAGGVLQFAVQLPLVFRLMRGFRMSLSTRVAGVTDAIRRMTPVVAARGAVQLSAYLDLLLASLLAAGAVGALGWAQTLYILPVSLFGLSVAAAELPELARHGTSDAAGAITERVDQAVREMAFVTVPTCIGYLAFGYLLVGALYRTGRFTVADNWLVYLVLAAYTVGLLASTTSRLLQSAFYALGDTRTPSRVAVVRVLLAAGLGAVLMLRLDRVEVGDLLAAPGAAALHLGAVGLALAAGVASWLELALLWRRLSYELPGLGQPVRPVARLALLAAAAALPAAGLWALLPPLHPILVATAVVGPFAILYLAAAWLVGVPEARAWAARLRPGTPGRAG
jgi:putative peptidoglycan lipid II flippase